MIFRKKQKKPLKKNKKIFFDIDLFLAANPQVQKEIDSGTYVSIEDYLESVDIVDAVENGSMRFHPLYDPFEEQKYLAFFQDVKVEINEGNFKSAFDHFVNFGYKEIIENRRIWLKVSSDSNVELLFKKDTREGQRTIYHDLELFDESLYLKLFPDIKESIEKGLFMTGLDHFCSNGYQEIMEGNRSFPKEYQESFLKNEEEENKESIDPRNAVLDVIRSSGSFNEAYYLENNSDVFQSGIDPLIHYLEAGWKEGRNPNPTFSTTWYIDNYKDVKQNQENPLYHYLLYGKRENRFQNKYEALKKKNPDMAFYRNGDEYSRIYNILQNSEYFDVDYYLSNNTDFKDDDIDPIEHYLLYGYKENKNPSDKFNTKFYLDTYLDVGESGCNPLVHFLEYGINENRITLSPKENFVDISAHLSLLNDETRIPKFEIENPIDIVIPVYNGKEFLKPLFKSLIKNTTMPYRLLVCDDKSSDSSVLPLLYKIKRKNKNVDIIILENKKNKGFIKTVNRLVDLTKNHFVLLNTDTEVPPFWIERLMYPIFKMKDIASTTPFTNAGTICSFPNYLEDNLIFENMNVGELDKYFQYVNFEKTHIEIPTGVGFCMGVNKKLVNKIGMFDTIFGKGYGEENDWCQKAIESGYKNIHVTNLFVYHKHGGSFPSEERNRLIANNLIVLNTKHQTFDKQVQSTTAKNELENLRNTLIFKIKSSEMYTTLIFDHDLGGGANHYTDDEINSRLRNSQLVCLVQYDFQYSKNYNCKFILKDREFSVSSKSIFNLLDFLSLFMFDEIFLNSFVSYPSTVDIARVVFNLQRTNKAKIIVSIHDFFPLCPNYTLLNEKMVYCDIPSDYTICEKCLSSNEGEFKTFENETNIENWRSNWEKVFEVTDEILCFSNASKEIFLKTYPINESKIIVKPHDISGRYDKIYTPENDLSELRIGILGGINEAKGAKVVENLVKYIDKNKLNAKVVLVGEISIPINSSSFQSTGRYTIEELPDLVKKLKITQFLIPSVWPETFSYTTDEIMQLGYPLIVFNLGAPAERVKDYELGKVVDIGDIYKELFGNA